MHHQESRQNGEVGAVPLPRPLIVVILVAWALGVLWATDLLGQTVTHTCPTGFVAAPAPDGGVVYRCDPNDPPDRWADALTVAVAGLAAADVAQTSRCLGAGTCREANPIMAPMAGRPVLFGLVKGALAASLVAHCRKAPARSPRRYGCFVGAVAVQAGIVAWNARALRATTR